MEPSCVDDVIIYTPHFDTMNTGKERKGIMIKIYKREREISYNIESRSN